MRVLALVPAVVFLSGCLQDLKVVRLKPDGSGTIVHTRRLREWVIDMIRKNGLSDDFTEEKMRENAAKLGAVEFVSAEKANIDGWVGMTSTYSFKDVSKVKLDDDGSLSIALEKRPNGNMLLTAHSPFKPSKPGVGKEESKLPDDLMRALFSGMKVSTSVEVDGTVVACSSPHVAGSVLTICELELDQLFAEQERLKKMAAREPATLEEAKETIEALRVLHALEGGGAMDLESARKALARIKGVKHALAPVVTLEFKPK